MINLALADIFIVVFGYPIAIHANLRGELLDTSHCVWAGFVNGTVGIASIFTLTEMIVVTYNGLKQISTTARLSRRQVICLIGSAWLYGGLCMLPPLLGWNRFVLAASKLVVVLFGQGNQLQIQLTIFSLLYWPCSSSCRPRKCRDPNKTAKLWTKDSAHDSNVCDRFCVELVAILFRQPRCSFHQKSRDSIRGSRNS
ncbi:hypothetical protein OS493_040482 [Desmophyllum pertusum]|uniref:G-protein coupled receptors family 1 profile domain-containing protein n=1 Tax=Desmophyllum pertusum TaxID=174260 RepID=A0A9X0CMH2_9CNID|nr:hypothetical protein OS493_040482 [Desmophyllum pertusum]